MEQIVLHLDAAVIMSLEHFFATAQDNAPVDKPLYDGCERGRRVEGKLGLQLPPAAAEDITGYLEERRQREYGCYYGSLLIEELAEKWRAALPPTPGVESTPDAATESKCIVEPPSNPLTSDAELLSLFQRSEELCVQSRTLCDDSARLQMNSHAIQQRLSQDLQECESVLACCSKC